MLEQNTKNKGRHTSEDRSFFRAAIHVSVCWRCDNAGVKGERKMLQSKGKRIRTPQRRNRLSDGIPVAVVETPHLR